MFDSDFHLHRLFVFIGIKFREGEQVWRFSIKTKLRILIFGLLDGRNTFKDGNIFRFTTNFLNNVL